MYVDLFQSYRVPQGQGATPGGLATGPYSTRPKYRRTRSRR